jgi:hypothetical protein
MNGRIKKRTTEAPKSLALTIVGKVKIGQKHPEKGYPMALDYFVCDTANAQYKQAFSDVFGDRPKALKIVFPCDRLEDICANYYEIRDREGKVFARGDGENFKVALKRQDRVEFVDYGPDKVGEYGGLQAFMEKIAKGLSSEKFEAKWKEKLTMRFILVGVNITGLWQLDTSASESSIPSMIAQIDEIMQKTGGRLSDIPFDLIVKMCKSDKSGDSKRYPVISIVCNYSPDDIQKVASLPTSQFFGILTSEKLKEISVSQNNSLLLSSGPVEDTDCEVL